MPVAGLKILVLIMKYQEPFKYQKKIHLRSACAIVCRRELRSLISMCICREINFIIVMNVFSVSCVCLKEIFSVHYGKCIQLAQNKTSDKHENSVFCEHHVRHREIWSGYLLRSFPSVSLQKQYFMFLIYLNGQKHASQPLYLK